MAAKVLFLGHLAPNPLWFNPELPSCHSKWLPNYFGLPTWLQTLSGSIQSCQVVKMAAKVLLLGHLAPNPLWFSPELPSCHSKWLPKYFSLAPNPLCFSPELPSCHSKWLPKYFSLATWLQTQEPRSNPDLIIIQSKWQPSF